MSVLYVTEPDDETGMVAAITDEPCPCGWPETVLHIMPDGATTRGCPSCETETQESADPSRCPKCGGPDPFHDSACAVHPDLAQDHENGRSER